MRSMTRTALPWLAREPTRWWRGAGACALAHARCAATLAAGAVLGPCCLPERCSPESRACTFAYVLAYQACLDGGPCGDGAPRALWGGLVCGDWPGPQWDSGRGGWGTTWTRRGCHAVPAGGGGARPCCCWASDARCRRDQLPPTPSCTGSCGARGCSRGGLAFAIAPAHSARPLAALAVAPCFRSYHLLRFDDRLLTLANVGARPGGAAHRVQWHGAVQPRCSASTLRGRARLAFLCS
jgi:hypothetical protein